MRFCRTAPILLFCVIAGCSRKTETALPAGGSHVVNMPMQDLVGLSGLARDDTGAIFTVPERDYVLVELKPTGEEQHRYPISGIPKDVELESLAWLGKDRFGVGTEEGCKDGSEHVYIVQREGDAARVTQEIKLPLSNWGTTCDEKRGIEGLCAAGGKMIAALENPLAGQNEERFAGLARIDEASGEVTAYRLTLTSKTGKIAGLDCRLKNGAIEVLAIERHFDVARLLTFTMPLTGAADEKPLQAKIALDLLPLANEGKRNFEGVVWTDDRHVLLIVDNHYKTVTGPNQMVAVELPGL